MMQNLGYDVETFLRSRAGYIPAERILSGTKGQGTAIGKGVLAHPDNVMAEISSAAPFDSENLYHRIVNDFNILAEHVAPVSVVFNNSLHLSPALLNTSTLACEIGCEQDFQYAELRDPISVDTLGDHRYAGGHLHFNINDGVPVEFATQMADVMLAVPLIAFGERQAGRRNVYGLPGLNRPKPYGFEYRTLSNYWAKLAVDGDNKGKEFCDLVHILAMAYLNLDENIIALGMEYADLARQIIMNEDENEALNLTTLIQARL